MIIINQPQTSPAMATSQLLPGSRANAAWAGRWPLQAEAVEATGWTLAMDIAKW